MISHENILTASKPEMLEYAHSLINKFRSFNMIIDSPSYKDNPKLRSYGLCRYYPTYCKISYNLRSTKKPTKTPGYAWSFPGYKADLTIVGVLTHEFGHWIQFKFMTRSQTKLWKQVVKSTAKVTSYEPNHMESFAETFKLFLTNPDLLKQGRPTRFRFLTEVMGFIPVTNLPWKTILCTAHVKHINAATNWCRKGKHNLKLWKDTTVS